MGLVHRGRTAGKFSRLLKSQWRKRCVGQRLLRKAIVETLETRTLLSNTYVVNSLDDNNNSGTTSNGIVAGEFRWVIQQADAAGGNQTITFDSSLTSTGPATIALNGTALELDDSTGTLTIQGPTGAYGLTINGSSGSSVFLVDAGSTAEINNLTITGGSDVNGGGIENLSDLTLNESTVTGNTASYVGGGIYSRGTLNLINSNVSNNHASFFGGGIYDFSDSVNATDSTISGNTAVVGGGGLESYQYNGPGTSTDPVASAASVAISSSTITENSAGYGGGVANLGGNMTISASTISGNNATSTSTS